jgi:hypothetical protein
MGGTLKAAALKSAIHFRDRFDIIRSMPQSLSKVIIHIIFSTKDREAWLDSNARPSALISVLAGPVPLEPGRHGHARDKGVASPTRSAPR